MGFLLLTTLKKNGTLNNKTMGRKKFIGKRYWVIAHPKVIIDVRKYAKEKSEEYDKNTRTTIDRASKD